MATRPSARFSNVEMSGDFWGRRDGSEYCKPAKIVSAFPIIGVDIVEAKVEMAKKWGVTHAFDSKTQPDYLEKIKALVGAQGADVVVDTTGNARVIETAYELTHPDGKTILVGVPRKGDNVNIYTLPLHFKKVLKGSHGGSSVPDVEIPRFIRLMKQGKMKLEGLVTHEFSLNKINTALKAVYNGDAGRVVINMGNF